MNRHTALTAVVVITGILVGVSPLLPLFDFQIDLGIGTLLFWLFIGIVLLLIAGVPLGFATGSLGAVVIWIKFGEAGLGLVLLRIYDLISAHVFIAIPFFIVMAALLERSGIAKDTYDALSILLQRLRGGVAIATTVLSVIMAAMSGIIGGEIVLLGLVALPQMLRLGYDKHLAIGTICAGGSLGAMIPPSVVLIIYGLITETSITKLFTASFIPGLMLAVAYILYIAIRTRLNPALAPLPSRSELTATSTRPAIELAFVVFPFMVGLFGIALVSLFYTDLFNRIAVFIFSSAIVALLLLIWLRKQGGYPIASGLLPLLVIVDLVLGSIYGGVTGITEAAAMGVVVTLLLIFIRSELNTTLVLEALQQTFVSVGSIMWVTFGATVLAGAFTLSGGGKFVADAILALDVAPIVIIMVMMLIFFLLGMFMDWVGVVLVTMPVFLPIVIQLGYDPIWFGVLFCVNMQMAFLTPPFGSAAFYLKSVAPPDIDLLTIYRSFIPFLVIQAFILGVLMAFPAISLFLVR
ncbi:TRAP transporter large permease subunit [Granulosicoccus sp.]|nr:TRAP transporter large permease subunit [Granulosicoccus sp.]MDB4222366.1 TRAP transporter large permease subunit [Granulosicoccus sp.]